MGLALGIGLSTTYALFAFGVYLGWAGFLAIAVEGLGVYLIAGKRILS